MPKSYEDMVEVVGWFRRACYSCSSLPPFIRTMLYLICIFIYEDTNNPNTGFAFFPSVSLIVE